MFKGDWLTIRNINSALFQCQDALMEDETFDFVEPVMGLFHLQMNVLKLSIGNYWGRADGKDLASLQHFVRMVGNNRVKKDAKAFRACLFFVNEVLDSHILAACMTATGTSTIETLATKLETVDWAGLVEALAENICSNKVQSWRLDPQTGKRIQATSRDRDIPVENGMLLRDMLVFREYEAAVKAGDPGRIEKVLEYWCVLFQRSTLSNYPREMVHLRRGPSVKPNEKLCSPHVEGSRQKFRKCQRTTFPSSHH
jgi:hypothetical protein